MTANAAAKIMELSSAAGQAVGLEVRRETLSELAFIAGICNAGEFNASTINLPLSQRKILGDATDQAVLRFAESLQSVSDMRYEWKSVFKLPFNSKNKFMGNAVQPATTGVMEKHMDPLSLITLTIKGAPDILLPRCTHFLSNEGRMEKLTEEYRDFIEKTKNTWSKQSKRVILMARKVLPGEMAVMSPDTIEFEHEALRQSESELELIGLVAMIDPPREEIPEVVRILRGAGLKIHMVTGDFKLTAQAIAVQCGIITQPLDIVHGADALMGTNMLQLPMGVDTLNPDAGSTNAASIRSIVLSGNDLTTLDDVQWDALCKYDEIVFARTTPEQKLRIVKELQLRGEVVGMTGDGVNDAPSLKAADIGIAMGSGSAVAIEAADMILLESFAAIVEAVKYGRVVFGQPSHRFF
jgi:sodium/potassium-transporting ATPase subunit alpha